MQGGALLGPGDGVIVQYWCSYLYMQSKKNKTEKWNSCKCILSTVPWNDCNVPVCLFVKGFSVKLVVNGFKISFWTLAFPSFISVILDKRLRTDVAELAPYTTLLVVFLEIYIHFSFMCHTSVSQFHVTLFSKQFSAWSYPTTYKGTVSLCPRLLMNVTYCY